MQVILAVADVTRSAGFYERAFGWARNPLVDYANYVELLPPDGGAIGLYERRGYAAEVGAEPAELGGGVSSAYMYLRVEDADETAAAIVDAGGRPLSPLAERDWGERAAWFADPDGHVLAVAQRVPTLDPAARPL
jgi:predicted enzyme related to lactoylglutathione lyase